MGNDCSVIRGDTETTLSDSTGDINSASKYDDDEECKWTFNPTTQDNDVMLINVTSTDVECTKASFKIAGTQYCQKANPFCLVFIRGDCKEKINIGLCQIKYVDFSPSISFNGKRDAKNNGFKLKYNFMNCEELQKDAIVTSTTPLYIDTTWQTSNVTTTPELLATSTHRLVESRNITTMIQPTTPGNPTDASNSASSDISIATIAFPILSAIILLVLILLILLYMRRRKRKSAPPRELPYLNTTGFDNYVAAEDVAPRSSSTLEFGQSYESIERGMSVPDIVPVYSVIRQASVTPITSQQYETVTLSNTSSATNQGSNSSIAQDDPNLTDRRAPTAVYSVVRKKPKTSDHEYVTIGNTGSDNFEILDNSNQYVAANDVTDVSNDQSYEFVEMKTTIQTYATPEEVDSNELYSVVDQKTTDSQKATTLDQQQPKTQSIFDHAEGTKYEDMLFGSESTGENVHSHPNTAANSAYDNPTFKIESEYNTIDRDGKFDAPLEGAYNRLSRC